MTELEQEVDQLFIDYFRDFSNLDLKAIVSYFHLPCVFIVPHDVLVFSTSAEVEAFWAPRFADMKASDFDHTERREASIQALNDHTAMVSGLAVRFKKDDYTIEQAIVIAIPDALSQKEEPKEKEKFCFLFWCW